MSQPTNTPKRRWFQFSLRSLLLLAALVALGALAWRVYVAPYERQRPTMALVERLGGSYETSEAPAWLRYVYGDDLQNVVLVNLVDCDVPDKYVGFVAALPALETLVVGGPAFTDEHLRRLHALTTLRRLVLDSTSVTESGLAALCRAVPHASVRQSQQRAILALEKLGYVGTQSDEDIPGQLEQLAEVTWFAAFSSVGDEDLVRLEKMGRLEWLQLLGTHVSNGGLAHLTALGKLRWLGLADTGVSDAGLAHLRGLNQLRSLDLTGTQVSDAGLEHLKGLTQLAHVYVRNSKVTAAGVAELHRALPNCTVYADTK